jgi:hypothetical protein
MVILGDAGNCQKFPEFLIPIKYVQNCKFPLKIKKKINPRPIHYIIAESIKNYNEFGNKYKYCFN